jgi:protoporphyrinogen oxidase
MQTRELPKRVVIVGAGPAGLFTARRLQALGVQHITLLEKEAVAGGKCHTFKDRHDPALITEYGAGEIAPNYGLVLDAVKEKNIVTEKLLPIDFSTIDFVRNLDQAGTCGKLSIYAKFAWQTLKFTNAVRRYNFARDNLKDLPPDFKLPFAEYAEKYGLSMINDFAKSYVAGYGYGDTRDCPTYSLFEYAGYLSVPTVAFSKAFKFEPLLGIHGGFQSFMEKLSKDFDVRTSCQIQRIHRMKDNEGKTIVATFYEHEGESRALISDAIVFAIAPQHWPSLGITEMTPIEQECASSSTYYRYIIAVCKIEGLPAERYFVPAALERENFNHVAYVSSRDARFEPEGGRLCTVYINTAPENRNVPLEDTPEFRQSVIEDLKKIRAVTNAEIIELKVWPDYFSSLPWDKRLELEKEQYANDTHTIYVGSATFGSFEDVASVAMRANDRINRLFTPEKRPKASFCHEVSRFFGFFKLPRVNAYAGALSDGARPGLSLEGESHLVSARIEASPVVQMSILGTSPYRPTPLWEPLLGAEAEETKEEVTLPLTAFR